MANNYTLFSIDVGDVTKEDQDWFKAHAHLPEGFDDWEDDKRDAYCKQYRIEDPDFWPGFQIEYGSDERPYVVLYSEESGNVDEACNLLQEFLKERRPDGSVEVEWACTCSKMRPGEFGGGAAFITAKKQNFVAGFSWLTKQREAWERRKSRGVARKGKKKARARAQAVR